MSPIDSNRRIPEEVSPMTEQQRRAQVTRWVAWHAAELAALGVPALLAITVSTWFWAVAAVAGIGWAVHEVRQQRRRKRLHTAKTHQVTHHSPSQPDTDPSAGSARENA